MVLVGQQAQASARAQLHQQQGNVVLQTLLSAGAQTHGESVGLQMPQELLELPTGLSGSGFPSCRERSDLLHTLPPRHE